jgi:hypothetical protein
MSSQKNDTSTGAYELSSKLVTIRLRSSTTSTADCDNAGAVDRAVPNPELARPDRLAAGQELAAHDRQLRVDSATRLARVPPAAEMAVLDYDVSHGLLDWLAVDGLAEDVREVSAADVDALARLAKRDAVARGDVDIGVRDADLLRPHVAVGRRVTEPDPVAISLLDEAIVDEDLGRAADLEPVVLRVHLCRVVDAGVVVEGSAPDMLYAEISCGRKSASSHDASALLDSPCYRRS